MTPAERQRAYRLRKKVEAGLDPFIDGRKTPRRLTPCGKESAYRRHLRYKEDCPKCRTEHAKRMALWRE